MNKHISGPVDKTFIFDVLSLALCFWRIFTHILVLLLWPPLPWEIVFDSKAADGAIRGTVRGLKVGHQLPCPHSQLFLQALPQQGLSSIPNIIEANLGG